MKVFLVALSERSEQRILIRLNDEIFQDKLKRWNLLNDIPAINCYIVESKILEKVLVFSTLLYNKQLKMIKDMSFRKFRYLSIFILKQFIILSRPEKYDPSNVLTGF